MTVTDEQVQALLDAYKTACQDNPHDWYIPYTEGFGDCLKILGLSAEAEQVRKEVAG